MWWCAVRAARVALICLGTTLAVVLGALLGPPAASADEPKALVSITLTAIEPSLPARADTITLKGRVTNTSTERLYRLQAIFWRNQAPITGREGIDVALASAANDPLGARFTRSYDDLYEPADPYLEPGKSASFTLRARVADLQLSPANGIYLMGVHVLANGNPVAIGRARVFVPVLSSSPAGSLTLTSIVVLSSRPSLVRDGVLADDHLSDELAPEGRLTALLAAADTDDVSFAVDPALVAEVRTMAGGYQVLDADGALTAGDGQAAAGRWLEAFSDLARSRDGYRLSFGSPDIAALVHDNQASLLASAASAGRLVDSVSDLPLLVMPTGGAADAATVAAAEEFGPTAILLSDTSASGSGPLLTAPGKAPIVTFSSAELAGGPGPDPRNTSVQIQQRALAEAWIEARTVSTGSVRGRVRLVTSADQAAGDDGTMDAPWTSRTTLSDLLKTRPRSWDGRLRYPASAKEAELTLSQLGSLKRFAQTQQTYAELMVDSARARREGDAAIARAASGEWRKHEKPRQAFLRPQQAALDAVLQSGVQISSNARVRTVAREGVEFPITIRNTLEGSDASSETNAVKVRLVFISENPQRLTIATINAPHVRAQESLTANAEVRARANGIVPVTAQLTTESGRPIGRPVEIQVQVTQNGTTGWAIALAAGLVLAGTTALRIRQVAKERSAAEAGGHGAPSSALSSAPPTDNPESLDPSAEALDG